MVPRLRRSTATLSDLTGAEAALACGDIDRAIALWCRVIEREPQDNSDRLFARAMTLLQDLDGYEAGTAVMRAAADAGHEVAAFHLGMEAFDEAERLGQDPDASDSEAREWMGYAMYWLRRAADGGSLTAAFNLGYLAWRSGDLEAARRWWHKAADAGITEARSNLAAMAVGDGAVATARSIWEDTVENEPNREALYGLGLLRESQGDQGGARYYFERAAELGHADARARAAAEARRQQQYEQRDQ